MSDLLGKVFKRKNPRGNEFDQVRIVGFLRSEEINEAIVAPIEHGANEQVDQAAFLAEYTTEGVEQIERDDSHPRGTWGDIAGKGRRRARGLQVSTDIDAEPLPLKTEAEERLEALKGNNE